MRLQVGIIGLGRIGRGVLRHNFNPNVAKYFDIRVVSDVMPIEHVAYLLMHDSTYGLSNFSVECDGDELILAGQRITYLRADRRRAKPDEAAFNKLREFNLDVIVEATGTADIDDFNILLDKKVATKILCTSNVKGCHLSMVYGINHQHYRPEIHNIISASTCTGNAFIPVCQILNKHFGIDYARVITIHPVLSDQHVLDGYHPSSQLGRAANSSIIPTSTNVVNSTLLVIPELAEKLEAISYRVPTSIVSVIDFTATLAKDTSLEELTSLFTEYARTELNGILHCDYTSFGHHKASIDFLATAFSSIILMDRLTLNKNRQLGLVLMHDNEFAYCARVLDVLDVININR